MNRSSALPCRRAQLRIPQPRVQLGSKCPISSSRLRVAHAAFGGTSSASTATAPLEPFRGLNSEATQLIRDEQQSLDSAIAALLPGVPASAIGGREELGNLRTAAASVVQRGAGRGTQDLALLEGSILALEQAYISELVGGGAAGTEAGAAVPMLDPTAVRAAKMWQPIFASAGGFPRLLYIPVPEYFDLSTVASEGTIDVITELGPFITHFYGKAWWENSAEVQAGGAQQHPARLTYAIDTLVIEVAGRSLRLPFRLNNSLTVVFSCSEAGPGGKPREAHAGFACARSALGGTLLMVSEPEGSRKYVGRPRPQATA